MNLHIHGSIVHIQDRDVFVPNDEHYYSVALRRNTLV